MDSPGNDVEVNVVVGREGPESLRDAAQAQPIFEGCIVTGWGDGGVGGQILPRLVPDVACADDAPTSTGSRRVVVSRGWPHSG